MPNYNTDLASKNQELSDILKVAQGLPRVKSEQVKTLEVTNNGAYNILPDAEKVLSKVVVNVNVSSGGESKQLDALIDGSITEITSNVTNIDDYAFANRGSLATINFPQVTSIGRNAFFNCNKITKVDFPKVKSVKGLAFKNCYILNTVNLPEVTSIAEQVFANDYQLEIVNLQQVTSIGRETFAYCNRLTTIKISSSQVCQIDSELFYQSSVEKGTGYIYVPKALVEQYKVATNWANYASQIRAIEDYPEIAGGM